MIMDFVPHGSLEDLHREKGVTPWQSMKVLWQGLKALAFLHKRNVIHRYAPQSVLDEIMYRISGQIGTESLSPINRDIKPDNILVSALCPMCIKLGDFGLSRKVGLSMTLGQGTFEVCINYDKSNASVMRKKANFVKWMSPESYDLEEVPLAADIWSLGVVVQYLVGFLPPRPEGGVDHWVSATSLFTVLYTTSRLT